MKQKTNSTKKVDILKIDKDLDKDLEKGLFKDKIDKANYILKTTKLPNFSK